MECHNYRSLDSETLCRTHLSRFIPHSRSSPTSRALPSPTPRPAPRPNPKAQSRIRKIRRQAGTHRTLTTRPTLRPTFLSAAVASFVKQIPCLLRSRWSQLSRFGQPIPALRQVRTHRRMECSFPRWQNGRRSRMLAACRFGKRRCRQGGRCGLFLSYLCRWE